MPECAVYGKSVVCRYSAPPMLGFHGTSVEIATRLRAGEPFRQSSGDGHWLGRGAYFFVPFGGERTTPGGLARRFAEQLYPGDTSVLSVELDQEDVLDLVEDVEAHELVRDVHRRLEPHVMPDQAPGSGWHRLDWYVIEHTCAELEAKLGRRVRSVRAVLEEYPPLYASSAILVDPHTQVAVRDLSAISDVELADV